MYTKNQIEAAKETLRTPFAPQGSEAPPLLGRNRGHYPLG